MLNESLFSNIQYICKILCIVMYFAMKKYFGDYAILFFFARPSMNNMSNKLAMMHLSIASKHS